MKVVNSHFRRISVSKKKLSSLLLTLASTDDKVWPHERWPAMRFKNGLQIGAKGGHGPIRYTIEEYSPGEYIKFVFSQPKGFNGHHYLELFQIGEEECEVQHTITMETSFTGSLKWLLVIRWLHEALIQDAFDKVENQFNSLQQHTQWSIWVRFLRWLLK